MARTNIEIDDEAVARVMARYDLPTKRAAVDFALRQVAGPPITIVEIDSLRGAWKGLEEVPIPSSPVPEWTPTSSTTQGASELWTTGEDPSP